MASNYLSPEQQALLEDYCERVKDQGEVWIKDASQKIDAQRVWVEQHGRQSIEEACVKLEEKRKWVEEQGQQAMKESRAKLQDLKATTEEQGRKSLQIVRFWLENLRAWLALRWRILRVKLDPLCRWITLQGRVCVEFVRLMQLHNPRFRAEYIRRNWKDCLIRAAIFVSVVLLLTKLTLSQTAYMHDYALVTQRDLPYSVRSRLATLSRMSPLKEKTQDGCLSWKGPPAPVVVNAAPPPTGLVVSMILGQTSRDYTCAYFPGQMTNFLIPQGLDILFLVPPNTLNQDTGRTMKEDLLHCLQLVDQPVQSTREWKNLDGTTLTTTEYTVSFQPGGEASQSSRNNVSIFLGETAIELPRYVRDDPSILQKPMPNQCEAPFNYIQGTRWYSNEMLHLAILKEYEYFVKLDADVAFVKPMPIHVLHDLKLRGALFGHTASFARFGQMPCGDEITHGIEAFQTRWSEYQQGNHLAAEDLFPSKPLSKSKVTWDGSLCSKTNIRMHMDTDYYYTNLIFGRTDYFQRPEVLALGRFLTEYPNGFFKYRWTDQIFWHFALGLFVDDFEGGGVVADYTDFRCAPLANCWWSYFNKAKFPLENEQQQCQNGGVFIHSKNLQGFGKDWAQVNMTSDLAFAERQEIPYESKYRHDCPEGIV